MRVILLTGRVPSGEVVASWRPGSRPAPTSRSHACCVPLLQRRAVKSYIGTVRRRYLACARECDEAQVGLSDATMVWSSGDGLKLDTVRPSLEAIAAWWIPPGQAIKGSKDSDCGAFFGFAVPVDFG